MLPIWSSPKLLACINTDPYLPVVSCSISLYLLGNGLLFLLSDVASATSKVISKLITHLNTSPDFPAVSPSQVCLLRQSHWSLLSSRTSANPRSSPKLLLQSTTNHAPSLVHLPWEGLYGPTYHLVDISYNNTFVSKLVGAKLFKQKKKKRKIKREHQQESLWKSLFGCSFNNFLTLSHCNSVKKYIYVYMFLKI